MEGKIVSWDLLESHEVNFYDKYNQIILKRPVSQIVEEYVKKRQSKRKGYLSEIQQKNLAWMLPRPKPDRYKGGMPLYAEEWLIDLGRELLKDESPEILNLFCGMNKQGFRIDIKSEVKPDLIADAHTFAKEMKGKTFNLILADPPYSDEEAKELYHTGKLNYSKWSKECDKVLVEGGILIVYHKYLVPNPDPEKYEVVKRVFIGNRTWHLPRVAIYFRKKITYLRGSMHHE